MTTLADMTPEQRAECVGLWCNIGPHEPGIDAGNHLFVLRSSSNYRGAQHAKLLDPISGVSEYISFKNVTLRPDIPRAWTPNGTPVPGEWETAKTKIIPNENARYDQATNTITGDAVADLEHEPKSAHDIRRWIGEWEPLP